MAQGSKRARMRRRLKKILNLFGHKLKKTEIIAEVEAVETTKTITGTSVQRHDSVVTWSPTVPQKRRKQPPPPPSHLTLLGLPRELRDLIFYHFFNLNGLAYVEQQLLGFPKGHDYSTYSNAFQVLLTSRQIYAEAFEYAYRLSCFYWSMSNSATTLTPLCHHLNAQQAKNVRHIAFWSNPYLHEEFVDDLPVVLNLTKVTVCSNYMSGYIPTPTVHGRMLWLLKNIKKLHTLKSFHFLTGCGISRRGKGTDFEFSAHLRRAFEAKELWETETRGMEVGKFDPETFTAKVIVLPKEEEGGARRREVELKIASVYEDSFWNR